MPMTRRHFALLCSLVAFGLAASSPGSARAEVPELFRLATGEKLLTRDSPAVTAAYAVALDTAVLAGGPPALEFPLPDGLQRRALRSAVEVRTARDLSWWGAIAGDPDSEVTLTLKDGFVAGYIRADRKSYELSPRPGGGYRLEAIDEGLLPPCGGAVKPREAGSPFAAAIEPPPREVASTAAPEAPELLPRDSAGRIDLLGVYTPLAEGLAGSAGAMAARIQTAVDRANLAFRNSNVGTFFSLVATARVNYTETADSITDLFWLAEDPTVAALRDQHRADLVGMTVSRLDNCGIGFLMAEPGPNFAPAGFQVTMYTCAISTLTYAHEHGHNMGAEHDPANAQPPSQASYPWSFGHFLYGVFATVMSYTTECGPDCRRVPYWSNPDVSFAGFPTGIADQRDNHRTLNLTAPIVANFRRSGGPAPTGPPAPANLAAEREGRDALLAWEDRASNEQGFRVYRGPQGGALAVVAELPANSTSYRDADLAAGATYDFQVGAFNALGEGKSAKVSLAIPAASPVEVTLVLPGAPAQAGDFLAFQAVTTGPVVRATWTFGADGLALSAEPCGVNLFCASHLFREPGDHLVAVEVEGDVGQTDQASATLAVAGPAPQLARREGFIQSVIFGPRGATGTYESNCWTHNAGPEGALVEYTYLPRGQGNPNPERREVALPAGQTLFVPNALATLFEEEDTQGSLALAYSSADGARLGDLRTHCRSFVTLSSGVGSFGQLVGEEPEASWSAAPKVATGIIEDEGFSATVLAANLDDRPGVVTVELTDGLGTAVGGPGVLNLGSRTMRFRPLTQLFPAAAGRPGPFSARFTSDGIRFAASFTLLENDSEDQIFVAAREPDGANPLFVPRVATSESQFGAFLVSSLIAKNNAASTTTLTLELWLRGQANLTPPTTTVLIPPHELVVVDDLVGLFGLESAVGAVRIGWQNAEGVAPRVLTYSLNQSGSGGQRFGMLVDGRAGATAGTSVVNFGAEQSDLFRADYGLVNLNPATTLVEVTLKEADGSVVVATDLVLKPQQQLERNLEGIFRDFQVGEGRNWTLEARVLAGGPILTYLANTNVSGDVFFVPGQPLEP